MQEEAPTNPQVAERIARMLEDSPKQPCFPVNSRPLFPNPTRSLSSHGDAR